MPASIAAQGQEHDEGTILVDLAIRETYAPTLSGEEEEDSSHGPMTTLMLADQTYRRALRQRAQLEASLGHKHRQIKIEALRIPKNLRRANTIGSVRHTPQYHSCLCPGRKFQGVQQSGRATYEVSVTLDHIDMAESRIAGTLRIQGLSLDHPTLTTCFEGEIIGNKHSFITHHKHWGASEKTDVEHWTRFQAFKPIASYAATRQKAWSARVNTQNATRGVTGNGAVHISEAPSATRIQSTDCLKLDHLFMRWKELHAIETEVNSSTDPGGATTESYNGLVSQISTTSIQQRNREQRRRILEGVSYEGFYYICLSLITGHISGMYFHEASELYQQLSLKPVDASLFPVYEWR
jgi:hypothetical protein